MEIIGYCCLFGMGVTLGMMGAGGSILTIPILAYIFKIPIILATTYSLAIVGCSALVATIRYRKQVVFSKSLPFSLAAASGVLGARHYLIPKLPQTIGIFSIEKILVILLLSLMLFASYSMIKNFIITKHPINQENISRKLILLGIGLSLGIVMGLLGAGGGFLIIPILVMLMGFTMKQAIPTSLFIITINSTLGFAASAQHLSQTDIINLVQYLCAALLGISLGIYCEKYIKGASLKKYFGYFILTVCLAIFTKEFILQ